MIDTSELNESALIDEMCDNVRTYVLHMADKFVEDAKQHRETYPHLYERAIQIRKDCDDLPMNGSDLNDFNTSVFARKTLNIALLKLPGVVVVESVDNFTKDRVGMRKIPPRTMYVSVIGGDINDIAQIIFDNIGYYNTWGSTIGTAIDEDGDEVLVRFDHKENGDCR